MPGIDQVLSVITKQGADELRLAADREPSVFAMGKRLRFTMAPTSSTVLHQLLGEILSPEREQELNQKRRLACEYELAGVGRFQVNFAKRDAGELEVIFTQSARQSKAVTATAPRAQPTAVQGTGTASPVVERLPTSTQLGATPVLVDMVAQATRAGASDIHISDGQAPFFRVDGRLRRFTGIENVNIVDVFQLEDSDSTKLLAGTALESTLDLSSRERLRVTVYRIEGGLAAAVRLLPISAPSLNELHLPVSLTSLAELPHGLVLVCGATGSGKSTTLAALSRHAVQTRSLVLVTLEDPIEFTLISSEQSIVRQRQIGRDVSSFTVGLRDALRADPDVIVVGELRDAETIRLALTAAETGHLVLASLHSGSAASCIERLVDAYPADQRTQIRVQLADALRAIVVQRLLPAARGSGRVVGMEFLRVTHGVANVIREGRTAQIGTALQAGKKDGMISLERCLADYVQSGLITLDVARAGANDLESLTNYLGK
ncbi:MAG TPA: PilT/PilU family type 4a pilus ATPase [Polyangiaceae bacterium]|nr:PilT/PilU family type 4a pilus ATPase [Polyangiaceae bacterium]